ncbi:MAG TPA: acyl carrier protein, partial [Stellaceae bacterium]|nr:acyl carrier protein [Stellaceae bacterium]
GRLASRPKALAALARRLGAKPMPARIALAGLSAMLDCGLPVVGHVEASWGGAQPQLPILAAPFYAELRAETGAASSEEPLAARLAALGPQHAIEVLKAAVAKEAAAVLRLPAGAIDPNRPLAEIGMDSLMALELRLALERRLAIDLPLFSLADGTSVAALAECLAAAASTGPRTIEVVALAARHERSIPINSPAAAVLPETKPEAAE